ILIGKRMLEHDDWFQMLDVFFRDSRNSLTPRVVVFDGEISDIVYLDRKEKPMLPMLLREMIVTKSGRTESTKTNLQELHRQIYEKGMTPYVPQVGLEHDEIALQGTALLDHRAKLAVSLNIQETVLLLMLQKEANHSTSLTIPVPGEWKKGPFHKNRLSFSMQKVKTTIGTSYANDRFQFDIRVDMRIALTELLFPYHTDKEQKQLEKKIASQVQKLIEDLIAKIQKHRVDPLGLGVYARAYAYKPYKQAEEHWGQAVADSNIRVKVHVEIGSTGPVK
ncbi:MAG: germination protein Ger(x)C family, partial [Paenibacillus sp.]|nr:germination protein Ger(x)C family [Paenibacillus sp.]